MLRVSDSQQPILVSTHKSNSDHVCLHKRIRFLAAALSQRVGNMKLEPPTPRVQVVHLWSATVNTCLRQEVEELQWFALVSRSAPGLDYDCRICDKGFLARNMCACTTQMAYTWTGSASQPQRVWCTPHVLCSCAHIVSHVDPVHTTFTVIWTACKIQGGSGIWHMYTMSDFWFLLDFLHLKIHHERKKRTCLGQPRQVGSILSYIWFTQELFL